MIPKFGGRDCELSSTGLTADGASIHAADVTRAVLSQIPAAIESRGGTVWRAPGAFSSYSIDCQRRWASNGGCHYGDLSHVECCTPTCLDPYELARRSLLSVRIAEEARRLAEAEEDDCPRYALSTANIDALDPSISFGTHLSMAIEKGLWQDLFSGHRRPGRLAMVASGVAAAIPFFGAGYLLPLKTGMVYSLSARAHHITRIWTLSTTQPFRRGILNSRQESHGRGFERLHMIGFDFCLSSGALLFSFLQCLLAAAEESYCRLQLVDPVRALRVWSWGLDLQSGQMPATAALVDGRHLTLPQYLRELTETLLQMAGSGLIPDTVAPHATELLPRIVRLTHDAEEGRIVDCARHLTWASKLLCLLGHCEDTGGQLSDPSTRLLDHDFSNTNPDQGLFWQLWAQGDIDPLVSADDVEAGWQHAPAETRDYARGRLIELFADQIADVDWDYVDVRRSDDRWSPRVRIELPSLDHLARSQFDALVQSATTPAELLDRLADARLAQSLDPIEEVTTQLALPGQSSFDIDSYN